MTDIVERYCATDEPACLADEFRAEIERLRADARACASVIVSEENERLRADKLHWEHQNGILEADIERLRAENQTAWNKVDELDERARHAEADNERLRAALEFYADPQSYHAIAFLVDRPAGGFADDFDDEHGDEFYERPMPGKTARRALGEK